MLAERLVAPAGPAVAGSAVGAGPAAMVPSMAEVEAAAEPAAADPEVTEAGAGAMTGAVAAPAMLGTPGSAIVPDPESGVFVARASMKADSGIRTRAVNARIRGIMEAIVTVARFGAGGIHREAHAGPRPLRTWSVWAGGHSPWGETLLGAGGRSSWAGSRQNRQGRQNSQGREARQGLSRPPDPEAARRGSPGVSGAPRPRRSVYAGGAPLMG